MLGHTNYLVIGCLQYYDTARDKSIQLAKHRLTFSFFFSFYNRASWM